MSSTGTSYALLYHSFACRFACAVEGGVVTEVELATFEAAEITVEVDGRFESRRVTLVDRGTARVISHHVPEGRSSAPQPQLLAPVQVELLVVVVVVLVLVPTLVGWFGPPCHALSRGTAGSARIDERRSRPLVDVFVLAHAHVECSPDLRQQSLTDARWIWKLDIDGLPAYPCRLW